MTQQNGHANSERETVSGERFDGERVMIDGKHFEDCHFETCTLVYRGGTPPNFVGGDFAAPRFVFEEAAQSTLQLMSAIYNGIDERIIGKTFDEIRKGFGDRWTSKGFGRTALFRFKYARAMEVKIYVMEDGNLHALSESTYDAEGKLQKLLRDHPDLLAGEQMTSAEPRRWVLADREFGISDESSGSRWALDHLFLDQDGIPTLVEVKRSSNRELRRQVVGQMFDYAANAIRYGDVDRIRRLFRKRHEEPEEKLQEHLGVTDPEAYLDEVRDNLDRGEIRMVFVADQIPSELRRIVEFLNGQLAPAEVLAVEVAQYEGEGLKTLVPRVVGQTAEAEQKKQASKTEWDESNFFEELQSRASEELARRVRGAYDRAVDTGCSIDWRAGENQGGFFVDVGDHRLFKFTVGGNL
jgi:hypothetical protein